MAIGLAARFAGRFLRLTRTKRLVRAYRNRTLRGDEFRFVDAESDMSGEIEFRENLALAVVRVMKDALGFEAGRVPIDTQYLQDTIAWWQVYSTKYSNFMHMGSLAYYAKYTPEYLIHAAESGKRVFDAQSFYVEYVVTTRYIRTYRNRFNVLVKVPLQQKSKVRVRYDLKDFASFEYRNVGANEVLFMGVKLPRKGPYIPAKGIRKRFINAKLRAKLVTGYDLGDDKVIRARFRQNFHGMDVFQATPRRERDSKYHKPPTRGRRGPEEEALRGGGRY